MDDMTPDAPNAGQAAEQQQQQQQQQQPQPPQPRPEGVARPAEDAVDITGAAEDNAEGLSGMVWKQILEPGDEDKPVFQRDMVSIHYTGRLASNNEVFDSSKVKDQPLKFTVGKGEVIRGMDVGVLSMKVGEKAMLTIASPWAYGENGSPPKIPGNATLVFEMEVLSSEGDDMTSNKDGGVTKRVVRAGDGLDHPNEGAEMLINVKGYADGRLFDDRQNLEYIQGHGCEVYLPTGLETAIERMRRNEEARIEIVRPEYAWGSDGFEHFSIKGDEKVILYTVELVKFKRAKESWQLDGEQKLEHARKFKQQGTNYLNKDNIVMASKMYQKIIEFLEHEISLRGKEEDERKSLLQAGRLNVAMCHLKADEWILARNVCDKILEENAECEKAYFRRGDAYMKLSDHDLAVEDYNQCLRINPENKAAKNRVIICKQAMKKQKEKEKRTFANMFDKFASRDAKKEEEEKRRQKPLEINEWETSKEMEGSNGGRMDSSVLPVSGDVKMNIDLDQESPDEAKS